MSREIKYRAWDKLEQRMDKVSMLSFPLGKNNGKDITVLREDEESHHWLSIDEAVLMQYVECIDSYEGDILRCTDRDSFFGKVRIRIAIVEFNHDKGRIMIREFDDVWHEIDDYHFEDTIGNAYEKPYLLEYLQ